MAERFWSAKVLYDILSCPDGELSVLARAAGGDPSIFFKYADLRGLDLSNQDLSGMDLSHAILGESDDSGSSIDLSVHSLPISILKNVCGSVEYFQTQTDENEYRIDVAIQIFRKIKFISEKDNINIDLFLRNYDVSIAFDDNKKIISTDILEFSTNSNNIMRPIFEIEKNRIKIFPHGILIENNIYDITDFIHIKIIVSNIAPNNNFLIYIFCKEENLQIINTDQDRHSIPDNLKRLFKPRQRKSFLNDPVDAKIIRQILSKKSHRKLLIFRGEAELLQS